MVFCLKTKKMRIFGSKKMAKIVLEGIEFYAFHGYYAQENKIGNRFVVDVEMEAEVEAASQADMLSKTVNYEKVYALVEMEMKNPSKLLETVAFNIKNRIVEAFPQLQAVVVRISKYNPPLGGKILRVYVEL